MLDIQPHCHIQARPYRNKPIIGEINSVHTVVNISPQGWKDSNISYLANRAQVPEEKKLTRN